MATFYIEAIEATTISLNKKGSPTVGVAMYDINNTNPSTSYTYGDNISLSAGDKCYWTITSSTTNFSSSNYLYFTSTGKFNVGGALSDLIGGNSFIPRNYCFTRLFSGCTTLVDASKLICVTDLNSKQYCYQIMFQGCTSLTTPPKLPATTLAKGCYQGMFQDCTSLTIAPELPATALESYCYQVMFRGCTSLTTPPKLPATTLLALCYQSMFSNCTSIKLSETQTDDYQIPYRIPTNGTGIYASESLTDMFRNTGGTFTGNPEINKTYYLFGTAASKIIINYNNEKIAEFDEGIKTLKCNDKKTKSDVVIAIEDGGTSNVSVTYNNSEIANFSSGTKTLKCSGKKMKSDVVISIS